MTRLRNRIEKLERGKSPTSENFAWARAPLGMLEEECRKRADAFIGDYFNGEDYSLEIERFYNVEDFEVYLVSTTEELDQAMNQVAQNGRWITDPDVKASWRTNK